MNISQWLAENYPDADPKVTVTDNRGVWFDLENLKEYICYVENRSETLGYENLGLRVYFGATTDSDSVPRSTVFFWPTHRFEPQMMNTEGTEGKEDTDETINANSSENENSYNIKGLNYGTSGRPPKIFDAGN